MHPMIGLFIAVVLTALVVYVAMLFSVVDRDMTIHRLKSKLWARKETNKRLKQEIAGLKKEVSDLNQTLDAIEAGVFAESDIDDDDEDDEDEDYEGIEDDEFDEPPLKTAKMAS